jgi:hypothetical protein
VPLDSTIHAVVVSCPPIHVYVRRDCVSPSLCPTILAVSPHPQRRGVVTWLLRFLLALALWLASALGKLPDPRTTPVLSVEAAGKLLGLGRHAAYNAARLGQLPTIRLGRKLMVPVAALRQLVGIDPSPDAPEPQTRTRPRSTRKATPRSTGKATRTTKS